MIDRGVVYGWSVSTAVESLLDQSSTCWAASPPSSSPSDSAALLASDCGAPHPASPALPNAAVAERKLRLEAVRGPNVFPSSITFPRRHHNLLKSAQMFRP